MAVGIILLVLGAGFWGCSKAKEEPKATEKSEARPSIAVEAAQVQAGDLVEGIEIVGSLTPKFEANLKSEYAGIITDVYVTEWVRVKKGTPLAKLDSREIEAMVQKAQAAVELGKANLLQSEVAGNRAEREFVRAQNLKESGLITQQNLDDAQTEKVGRLGPHFRGQGPAPGHGKGSPPGPDPNGQSDYSFPSGRGGLFAECQRRRPGR